MFRPDVPYNRDNKDSNKATYWEAFKLEAKSCHCAHALRQLSCIRDWAPATLLQKWRLQKWRARTHESFPGRFRCNSPGFVTKNPFDVIHSRCKIQLWLGIGGKWILEYWEQFSGFSESAPCILRCHCGVVPVQVSP